MGNSERLLLLLSVGGCGLSGCLSGAAEDMSRMLAFEHEARSAQEEMRFEYHRSNGGLRRAYAVQPAPPGFENQHGPGGLTEVRHGPDTEWYEGGALRAERHFHLGRPIGRWRTYYESGATRSEVWFGEAERRVPMTWWYEDGRVQARGPMLGEAKDGEWTFWHPNGQRAEQGEYRMGVREGTWTSWDLEGRLLERGSYENNRRVGAWESAPQEPPP